MSKIVFDIGDTVSFNHEDKRLFGKIVRVYNTGDVYHAVVDGVRYEVDYLVDSLRKENSESYREREEGSL